MGERQDVMGLWYEIQPMDTSYEKDNINGFSSFHSNTNFLFGVMVKDIKIYIQQWSVKSTNISTDQNSYSNYTEVHWDLESG